jgi:plastocyanin
MRRIICIGVVAAAIAGSMGIPLQSKSRRDSSPQDKAMASEVKIDNFSFAPQALTVAVGTTVTWTNRDDIPHTVVSTDDPKAFKSKVLDTDEKFSFTFSKPGNYAYFCSVHPKMTGKVTVQ